MIEPDCLRAALLVGRNRFPTAIAGCISARHERGLAERSSAVGRLRSQHSGAACAPRRPHDHDSRHRPRAACEGHSGRLLTVGSYIARRRVDSNRCAKRGTGVTADGGEDVCCARRDRRGPHGHNERLIGGQRDICARSIRNSQDVGRSRTCAFLKPRAGGQGKRQETYCDERRARPRPSIGEVPGHHDHGYVITDSCRACGSATCRPCSRVTRSCSRQTGHTNVVEWAEVATRGSKF